MGYRDPEKKRAYEREYKRLARAAGHTRQAGRHTPCQTPLNPEFRLRTALDVLNLIAEQVAAVRAEQEAGTLEKARTIGLLAGVALRAVEVANLSGRVEPLEQILKQRKEDLCGKADWPELTAASDCGNAPKP